MFSERLSNTIEKEHPGQAQRRAGLVFSGHAGSVAGFVSSMCLLAYVLVVISANAIRNTAPFWCSVCYNVACMARTSLLFAAEYNRTKRPLIDRIWPDSH